MCLPTSQVKIGKFYLNCVMQPIKGMCQQEQDIHLLTHSLGGSQTKPIHRIEENHAVEGQQNVDIVYSMKCIVYSVQQPETVWLDYRFCIIPGWILNPFVALFSKLLSFSNLQLQKPCLQNYDCKGPPYSEKFENISEFYF